jgi:hypothetical protein
MRFAWAAVWCKEGTAPPVREPLAWQAGQCSDGHAGLPQVADAQRPSYGSGDRRSRTGQPGSPGVRRT